MTQQPHFQLVPERTESRGLNRDPNTHVLSSAIHNRQRWGPPKRPPAGGVFACGVSLGLDEDGGPEPATLWLVLEDAALKQLVTRTWRQFQFGQTECSGEDGGDGRTTG